MTTCALRLTLLGVLFAAATSTFLRGETPSIAAEKQTVHEAVRKLLVDADRSKRCFVDGSNQGLRNPHDADFNENPWRANNDRGDWGKCLPEEVFGVLCVHENAHGVNDNWQPSDGPLHDGPAQELFLKLQQLHNDYCVHVDVKIPDDIQEKFNDFYFARNKYNLEGLDPWQHDENTIVFTVTPTLSNGKKYTQNGVLQPPLTMVRGETYTFDTSDSTMRGHPLSVRISEDVPIDGVYTVGSLGWPGSRTVFTVPLDAPDTLTYYCMFHVGMGTDITVTDPVPAPARRLDAISYDTACTQTYPDDPRMALQMSLYCLLGFVEDSLDTSLVRRDYGLSSTCQTILRHNMRNQLTQEISYPPHMFCESDADQDTCTVHADIRTDGMDTCDKYCSQFENLECKSAGVNTWSDQCTEKRPWTCDAPAMDSNLMCTCGPVAIPYVPSDAVTTSCAKQLLPSDYPPYKFCSQDFAADTCTTQNRLNTLGTCTEYCKKHDLQCVAAHDDSNCVGFREYECDEAISSVMLCTCGEPEVAPEEVSLTTPNCDAFCSTTGQICISASATREDDCVRSDGLPCTHPDDFATILEYVCGEDVERPEIVEEMSTDSCAHMMFYRDPISKPLRYCPPHTLSPAETDTCTVLAHVSSLSSDVGSRTCDAYCKSFPGMKCVAAGEEVNNDCNVKSTLLCTEHYSSSTSDLLCSCAVDTGAMSDAVDVSNTPISPACENLMMSPAKDNAAVVERFCESFPNENTCTVLATVRSLPARSCDMFCDSYHGMKCVAAALDKSSTCKADSDMTCDQVTTSNDLLCTCGFKDGSPRATYFDMSPALDEKNALRTCPVYDIEQNSNEEDYHTNENDRRYTMVELTLDIPDEGTGAAIATSVKVRPDYSNSDLDTYNTAHVEACDGFESQIRDGDPEEKCSFGHRLDKSQNCYGKVYGQNFYEASAACEKRGGHIVRIDDAAEYDLLQQIFGTQTFSIGLHDVGGRDWEWDGYPGVDASADTKNSYAPLNDNEKEDCTQLNLRTGTLTGRYCYERETYMCEGKPENGGDLLADEGGFCLWYLDDPTLELPDDEDNGFTNTELANFLLYDEDKRTRKYIEVNNRLYAASNIPGYPPNEANWDELTYRKLGLNSDEPLVEKFNHNKSYHCHYSPTNFGLARIYIQQHMLERIYPGSMHKHCFCGYKHLGHFVDRCDCTRSGERNGQCQKHHREQLWTETYRQTGEYVYCNNGNCEGASP
jgi:hypothetical protein